MTDTADIRDRARQVVANASDGATASPGLVADLLAALDAAEAYAVERSKLASDTRHAAMQFRAERDELAANVRKELRQSFSTRWFGEDAQALNRRLLAVVDAATPAARPEVTP